MLRVLDRIEFLCGDLLEPVAQRHTPFIIVSNPPYLSDSHGTQMRTYEPSVALQGGEGGTTVLRTLVSHARAHPWCRGIFLECEENQLCVIDSVCGKAPRIPRSSVCGDRRAVGR
jgi:methylase of polypeptide subunit release factors